MSYPYPQDRHRDRREKGEQPYKAAREALTEQDAQLQAQAEEFGETHGHPGGETTIEDLEAAAEASMRNVHADRE
jgi:hypothetical protein